MGYILDGRKKTLIPNEFRDFLSIFSFIGFLAIILKSIFSIGWLSNNMTGIFLITGGLAFLVLGKVINIKSWISDGIQPNEFSFLVAIITGVSTIIIGILMLLEYELTNFMGYIGIMAAIPTVYIAIDYVVKNIRSS